jgi:hypothetical protein
MTGLYIVNSPEHRKPALTGMPYIQHPDCDSKRVNESAGAEYRARVLQKVLR